MSNRFVNVRKDDKTDFPSPNSISAYRKVTDGPENIYKEREVSLVVWICFSFGCVLQFLTIILFCFKFYPFFFIADLFYLPTGFFYFANSV